MRDQEEEEIIFWIRVIKGQRISFRREDGIDKLGLSGPLSTKLFNRTKQLIALLEHRNDWACCVNAYNPGIPAIMKPEMHERFVFEKYDREFVLTFNADEGRWSLGLLNRQQPPGDNAAPDAPPPDEGGGGPGVGDRGDVRQLPRPAAARPPVGDEYRPISAAPRRTRDKRALRTGFLWSAYSAVRQSPRFRHTASQIAATMAAAREALRRFAGEAQNALLLALGCDDGPGNGSATRLVHLVQDNRFGAVLEPQIIERSGLRLTVWTFSEYAKPRWELWLFGRLREDEHLAYEVG